MLKIQNKQETKLIINCDDNFKIDIQDKQNLTFHAKLLIKIMHFKQLNNFQ